MGQERLMAEPNQNIMIVDEIEGLISQIGDKIWELSVSTVTDSTENKKLSLKYQATEEIDLFQKTTLCELKKAFE